MGGECPPTGGVHLSNMQCSSNIYIYIEREIERERDFEIKIKPIWR